MVKRSGWMLGILSLLGLWLGPTTGWATHDPDLNNDGVINALDTAVVGRCFGQQVPTMPPGLRITTPLDGSVVASSPLTVSGTVDPASVSVTVNSISATVLANGTYSVPGIALQEGANTLTATATRTIAPCWVADLNHDGKVDMADYQAVAARIGQRGFPLQTPTLPQAVNTTRITVTLDSTPPGLAIIAPAQNSTLTQQPVSIVVTYSDTGSGVDRRSLVLRLNGSPIVVDCQHSDTGATCLPTERWPDGPLTLEASLRDLAGNAAAAQVQVTMRSVSPPVVELHSPADGTLTRLAAQTVSGTVSDTSLSSATLRHNGSEQVIPLVQGAFSVPLTLSEGLNTLSVAASNSAGTGSSPEVQVRLDTLPPSLAITTPAAGSRVTENPPGLVVQYSDSGSGINPDSLTFTANGNPLAVDCTHTASEAQCTPQSPLSFGRLTIVARLTDLAGNPATAQTQCTLAAPLAVSIEAPAEGAMLNAAPIAVRGTVSDVTARAQVQNVLAKVSGTNYEANNVPLAEGPNTLTVRARNFTGTEATATRAVVLDTVPPLLNVHSPADRAIVNTTPVPVLGIVFDATPVTCSVNGSAATVEDNALTGSATLTSGHNDIAVACQDAAGNVTRRQLMVYFDATPLQVTGITPADGATGVEASSVITATFSETIAPASLAATSFYAQVGAAILPARLSLGADGQSATLTPTTPLPAGATVQVVVTPGVTDVAGNPLAVPFRSVFTTAGEAVQPGALIGEVYDDTRSLPLARASVEVLDVGSGTVPSPSDTDERGRYLLPPGLPQLLVRITKLGFTTVERQVVTQAGVFTEVLDARLTPLAAPHTVSAALGTDIATPAGDVLTLLPGALSSDTAVSVTAISPQGPQRPFPPGWAPLAMVQIDAPVAFHVPAILTLQDRLGVPAGQPAVLARYDAAAGLWVALATLVVPAGGLVTFEGVTGAGQFALLVADTGTGATAAAVPGEALPAGTSSPLPADATASGVVVPPVGRADDPTPAQATITLSAATPLPSGTLLRGDFREEFLLRHGGRVSSLDTAQDLVAYRTPADASGRTLLAQFLIAASRLYGLGEISEGTITVDLHRGQALSRSLIGVDGGGLATPDGSRLMVPPGALPGDLPLRFQPLAASMFPLDTPTGLTFLGGFALDLFGEDATVPLTITLEGAAALVPTGSQVVVAAVQHVQGRSRLVPVAVARVEGAGLTSVTHLDGVSLPGIRAEGRYGFYRLDGALTVVAGTARDAAGQREGHAVELQGQPFVSVTDTAGRFVLPAPPGAFVLVATGAVVQDQARVTGHTSTPLPEIVIGPTPPRVECITVRPPPLAGTIAGPVVLAGTPAPLIDDDASGDSSGNGDGRIDPGERIELTLAIRNNGNAAALDGAVALRLRGPAGEIDVTPLSMPLDTLPPDEPVVVGPFVFTVPADVDPALLRFTLFYLLPEGGVSNQIPFELPFGVEHPNVSIGSEITVYFSEPVVAASLEGALTLAQEQGNALLPVATKLLLNADGTVATLRPLAVLADSSTFRITLGEAIADRDGRALAGAPVIERFRTEDRTPPPPIDPGRIDATVPDANGMVTVTGAPGAVNPDDTVILLNSDTGFNVLATVNPDGSFVARILADMSDQLVILLRDRNNNQTSIPISSLVRRDPVTGTILSAVIGRQGGTFTSADGIRLIVPAGSLAGATELSVARLTEPFALPPDIAADPIVAAAFAARFTVVERLRITASVARFAGPVRLALPAPPGAASGDLFLVVRSRSVTSGGLLADLDNITGLTAAQNPLRTVERLEILETASVKQENNALVLSTDSPPFPGVEGPGEFTMLRMLGALTFLAGEVRRDTVSGPPVANAVIQSIPGADATAPFATVTDEAGRFVVADAAAGGPYDIGAVVSSRLDLFDPNYRRVIRRDVRGVVGPPAPPNTIVAYLLEPFVLPTRLPSVFSDILGDIEPPDVEIRLEGDTISRGTAKVGEALKVKVVSQDNDKIEFIGLEVNQGSGFKKVTLAADGTFEFTPHDRAVLTFRAQVRDRSGNTTFVDSIIRTVAQDGDITVLEPLLNQPPVLISTECERGIAFEEDIRLFFSEPLDQSTVNHATVQMLAPEGNSVQIDLLLTGSMLTLRPHRNLRLGAKYTVALSPSILDLQGQSLLVKPFKCQTLPLVQVAKIALPNAEDVALMGGVLVTINHPEANQAASTEQTGTLHAFQIQDEAGNLLPAPRPLSSVPTQGRSLSLTTVNDLVFVGNRYLGTPARMQAVLNPLAFLSPFGAIGLTVNPLFNPSCAANPALCQGLLSFVWASFPNPPSNLQVFDFCNPRVPESVGIKELNHLVPFDLQQVATQAPSLWNPNTFPVVVDKTAQGIAVLNFQNNVEFFSMNERPHSLGVVERVQGYGSTLGRCQGGMRDDAVCVIDFLSRLSTGSADCAGASCKPTDEFFHAAFFDGFAVTVEQGGVRIISTRLEDLRDPLAMNRTLAVFPLPSAFGSRVGAVPAFEWYDSANNRRLTDLAFIAGADKRLTILDVTNPIAPAELSVVPNVFGNMSFDDRGLVYLHGRNGEFHVIDFNDPSNPIELNAPGNGQAPFSVQGLGTKVRFKGNAYQVGVVALAGETGVAIIQVPRCTESGCPFAAQTPAQHVMFRDTAECGPKYDLLVDVNKDGRVDTADAEVALTLQPFKSSRIDTTFDLFAGQAIFTVNYDADGGRSLASSSTALCSGPVPDAIHFDDDGNVCDEDETIDNATDAQDIAPLVIKNRHPGRALRSDEKVFLKIMELEALQAINVYKKIAAGEKAIWGKTQRSSGNTLLHPGLDITPYVNQSSPEYVGDAGGRVEFGVEGLLLAGMGKSLLFRGEVTFVLEVSKGGSVIHTSTAKMRVAPWIMLPNTQDTTQVWAAEYPGDNDAFIAGLDLSGQLKRIPRPIAGGPWIQDHVEIGFYHRPGTSSKYAVFRLPYDRGGSSPQPPWPIQMLLASGVGIFQLGNSLGGGSGDYGGNLELMHPTQTHKLGRIVYGNTMTVRMVDFLKAQQVQTPIIVDTSWLDVGHVDEVLGFTNIPNQVVVADPRLAYEIIERIDAKERGKSVFFAKGSALPEAGTVLSVSGNRIITGIDHTGKPWKYIRIYDGTGAGQVGRISNTGKNSIEVDIVWITGSKVVDDRSKNPISEHIHNAGVHLRVDTKWSTPPTTNDKYVLVEDTHFWTMKVHPYRFPAIITVDEILRDADLKELNTNWINNTIWGKHGIIPEIQVAAGSDPKDLLNFIRVPAIYTAISYIPQARPKGTTFAFVPGLANFQAINGRLYFPKPYGPRDSVGNDLFEQAVKKAIPTAEFIDDWDLYHRNYGEVHCGSVTKLQAPIISEWWKP